MIAGVNSSTIRCHIWISFMQQLIDYAAVLAFLIAYFVSGDMFIATAVLVIGVTLQLSLIHI